MSNQRTIQQTEAHIKRLTKTHQGLFRRKSVLDKGIVAINKRLQADRDKLAQLHLDNMATAVDWAYLLVERNSMVIYRELQKQLEPLGLRNSGYFPATGQRCLSFNLYKKDDEHTKLVAASLKMLLPFLLPQPDGYIHVDFMEKTLSEYGSYSIYLKPDLTGYINCRTYGRDKVILKGNLDQLLIYIQEHHYYSKRK